MRHFHTGVVMAQIHIHPYSLLRSQLARVVDGGVMQ